MIRRPPRSTQSRSSAASDVYKRQAVAFTSVSVPLTFIYLGYYLGSLFMPPAPRIPEPDIVKDMSLLNYSWYNTHNLTIAFAGGIGNQMFQYAALYGISKANGFRPLMCGQTVVGRVFRQLKVKRIQQDVALVSKSYGVYLERKTNAFDSRALSLNFMRNIVLDGFYQSWRSVSYTHLTLPTIYSV